MKLSILICGLENRKEERDTLINALINQSIAQDVEILIKIDNGEIKIGYKRNVLLNKAQGEYVCFIDDDDMVSSDYISKALKAIESKPDCCSLTGVITWDGDRTEIFEHSIKYSQYKTTDNAVKYERYPNHLNVIKSSIAKQFKFPEINHGEDTDWATQIHNSGLLKKETEINGVLYHYNYKTNK